MIITCDSIDRDDRDLKLRKGRMDRQNDFAILTVFRFLFKISHN